MGIVEQGNSIPPDVFDGEKMAAAPCRSSNEENLPGSFNTTERVIVRSKEEGSRPL